MASAEDLTTLDNLKGYLPSAESTSTNDPVLSRIISAASGIIRQFTQRPSFYSRSYTETYSGLGRPRLALRNFPVTAIASLSVAGIAIQPTSWSGGGIAGSGFMFTPWDGRPPGSLCVVDLFGSTFPRVSNGVVISYTAGFCILAEPALVPAAGAVAVLAPWGNWMGDLGVVNAATGAALAAVIGTPSAGQYQIDPKNPGNYIFGDTPGTALLISYNYVPAEIEQACIELAASRFKFRTRIDESSKTLGGQETIAFSLKDISDTIRLILNQYTNQAPI
jgi:hypothetical protein